MVRISTTYDKDLNQKVFLVRGDEVYTRTTDTILTVTERNATVQGQRVTLEVDVKRDIGSSSVVIYDGDSVLGVYDYSSDDSSLTIGDSSSGGFILTYGVSHYLSAKYLGNANCLGSKSKIQELSYTIPDTYKTAIAFSNTNAVISESGTYSSNVTVTINGSDNQVLHGLDIIIYVDDVPLDNPITTGESSNVASLSLTGLTKGLHTITAEVLESSNVNGATQTTSVGVGYIVEFTEYPSKVYSDGNNTFKGTVNDYFGNTISTGSMGLCNSSGVSLATGSVSNNSATISYNNATDHTGTQAIYKLGYGGSYSDTVTMRYGSQSGTLTITSADITGENTQLPITITLKDSDGVGVPNTAITVSYQGETETKTTNANGECYITYIGEGYGKFTLTATKGNLSASKTITDYEQYWNLTSGQVETAYGKSYDLGSGATLTKTSQGYYLTGDLMLPYGTFYDYTDSTLSFTAKSSSEVLILLGSKYSSPIRVYTNDVVKAVFTKGSGTSKTMSVYVNDTLRETATYDEDTNKIGIGLSMLSLYFNELKILPTARS